MTLALEKSLKLLNTENIKEEKKNKSLSFSSHKFQSKLYFISLSVGIMFTSRGVYPLYCPLVRPASGNVIIARSAFQMWKNRAGIVAFYSSLICRGYFLVVPGSVRYLGVAEKDRFTPGYRTPDFLPRIYSGGGPGV